MRPAWLPSQSSTNPTDATPSRPRSAASPVRDAMVQSARQHLDEPPVSTVESTVSLREFKDSFPLVPLSIIPRLSLPDLTECEAGLFKLLQSLAIDSNNEDAQLAKYITRQLGLVQRQLEQTRARDRVTRLLNGEEPISVEPLAGSSYSQSKSSKALPLFLQPIPSTESKLTTQSPRAVAPPLTHAKSASALGVKRGESTNQLSKAKAIAKATVSTAFVITTSETSMKARQKRAKKKTKEQIEVEKEKHQEREKEKRRQAAYQRLMVRQALQASKKRKKTESKHESGTTKNATATESLTNCVGATENTAIGVAPTQDDSSSSESDVSNCSESDADDEKAIMGMPVVIKVEEEVKPEETEEILSETMDPDREGDGSRGGQGAGSEEEDNEEELPENNARETEEEMMRCSRGSTTKPKSAISTVGSCTSDQAIDFVEPGNNDSAEELIQRPFTQISNEVEKIVPQTEDAPETPKEEDEGSEQHAREEATKRLQAFMAERAEAALAELRSRHVEEQRSARLSRSRPSTLLDPVKPPAKSTVAEGTEVENTELPTSKSPTKKRPLPHSPKLQPIKQILPNQTIPRCISREIKDYRSYFANFFCILTSVYEQRTASITGHGGSASSSSLLTVSSTNATHAGDQALRLQLKLYQGWQTIMNDYATVFGSSIPTLDGLYSSSTSTGPPSTAHYRINSQSRKEVSDIVVTALEKLGDWDEHPSGLGLKTTWNLLWTWSKPNVQRKTLLVWQKVNHFQHAKALTRKDCLKKNIGKYQAMGGRLKQAYDIVPASFLLPNEYVAFVQAFQERAKTIPPGKNIWIMKPVALSRGRGISLVNNLADVVYGEQVVIQEYIANPLLLDGFKFDLRLYVLVTSFNPLEVFFYEEGFVRMCTRAYEDSDISNLFIHLTNSSIQKENQDAIAANPDNPINNAQDDAGGTKMTLAYLWKRLEAMGADVAAMKNDILTVILKALMCGEDHIPFQVNSFDLYGYDILLDTNFRPWLIEINSSPSMARENELDYQVKDALIYDTLRLVHPLHFDRSKLVDVISRRFHDAEMDRKRSHANTRHPREAEEIAARQLDEDLTEILRGHVPRAYGEMPEHTGSYTRLAPHTTIYNQLVKMKKSCLRPDRR